MTPIPPGRVRDAVEAVMQEEHPGLGVGTIQMRVAQVLGVEVPRSSITSSLNLRSETFEKVGRGQYKWVGK